MSQFNTRNYKKRTLVDLLLTTPDRRRSHYIYLTSCYFTIQSARNLINEINKTLNVSDYYIYIDRKTAVAIGKDELECFANSFRNADVTLYAVETTTLFHSKAYAAISYDDEGEIYCGSLVVGSANLTGNGIIRRNGNIESMLETQEIEHLVEFTEQLDSLHSIPIEEIEEFEKSDSFSFKYALLQEGVFIHKWADNLANNLSIRYHLNTDGKERLGDSAFSSAGFNIATATISKQYFKFDYKPPHLDNSENLSRKYGIETYLGYWVPYEAAESLIDKEKFKKFKKKLKKQLQVEIKDIKQRIQHDYETLCTEGIIDESDIDMPESFEIKANKLLDNDFKLMRIFNKYETFYLPFDINQKEEIEELFDEMLELVESRKAKNTSMKAFLKAIKSASLDELRKSISVTI